MPGTKGADKVHAFAFNSLKWYREACEKLRQAGRAGARTRLRNRRYRTGRGAVSFRTVQRRTCRPALLVEAWQVAAWRRSSVVGRAAQIRSLSLSVAGDRHITRCTIPNRRIELAARILTRINPAYRKAHSFLRRLRERGRTPFGGCIIRSQTLVLANRGALPGRLRLLSIWRQET